MQRNRLSGSLRFFLMTVIVAAAAMCCTAARAAEGNVDLPRFPSISPDGKQVMFSWRGDLWLVSAQGGPATRMTSHPSEDTISAWSPDGTRIAFNSDRDGYTNIFIMNADGTGVTQVTKLDRPCTLIGFGVDEEGREVLTFESDFEGDVYRSLRPYMVSTGGGDIERVHDAFGSQPCVSQDGRSVAFTRGGYYTGWQRRHYMGPESMDVWLFDRTNNSFRQLTTWAGNDGDARWGGPRTLIYMSDREKNCVNLWRMSADEGEAKSVRLTDFEVDDVQAFDVSADGSTAVMTVWDTLYTLDLSNPNATPKPIAVTANEDELDNSMLKNVRREVSEAALSPDGKVIAMIAYGEVYVREVDKKSPTRRVTFTHAREKNLAWSSDGLKLYFTSDSAGRDGIYVATVELTRKEAREGFEKLLEPGEEAKDEAPAAAAQEEPAPDEPQIDPKPAPAPAGPEAEAGDAPAADDEAKGDDKADEADDDAKEEDDPAAKFYDPARWRDAVRFTIQPVVVNDAQNRMPSLSPDGKWLAYKRGLGDLMLLELATNTTRELLTSWDEGLHWSWAPDSKHIAYVLNDLDYNADIWITPIDDITKAVNITRHPDNDESPQWSADGKVLSFISERVNEEFDVWMVYLDKNLEAMTPKELEDYYKSAAEAAKKRKPLEVEKPKKEKPAKDDAAGDENGAKPQAAGEKDDAKKNDEAKKKDADKPLKLDLDDAYLRVKRVTSLAGNEGNNAMTPGGDVFVFSADLGDGAAIYSMKWNGEDRKRITGPASVQHLSLTGEQVVIVASGRAGIVKITGGEVESFEPDDQMRIDLQQQSSQKFLEAARTLEEIFYHPTMKGLDWPALTRKYHALAKQARTAGEFNHVANRFIGELNASHLGIRAPMPESPLRQPSGRIGVREERVDRGFRVVEVVPDSPADRGTFALKPGDVITQVDFKPIESTDTLVSLLEGKVGVETAFTIERTPAEGATVELTALITPVSWAELRQLLYVAWQKHNRALVEEWSEGRLGYFHMQAMGQPSLDEFERDLFAAAFGKDGLVMDVRNNGGGWTTDRVLASIMVQEHAYTLPKGVGHEHRGHYPQDRLFIQRYTMPMNLLCNEKSFSNAEIMSHAFQTLKRGTLVGEETYGGVISTGGMSLIDGTFVRLPLRGWFLPDGTDMENHGAVPDILVKQTPEDEVAGVDAQLRAAVEDLLKRVR